MTYFCQTYFPFSFDCVQYADNESTEPEESDIINIIREGITNRPYTSDLLNQQAPKHIEGYIGKLSSKFKLNYTLEKASMSIESIEGNLDILVDDKCILSSPHFDCMKDLYLIAKFLIC